MEYKIVSSIDPSSVISEEYRKLRTNIDFSSFDEKLKVLNITSSSPSEGKTITLLNLATVIAQNNKSVIIVDLDLRKPKIHRAVSARNINGVTEFLSDEVPLDECIKKSVFGFYTLFAGQKTLFPSELLNSKKIRKLIEELKQIYDYVLMDFQPANLFADANLV